MGSKTPEMGPKFASSGCFPVNRLFFISHSFFEVYIESRAE
jgi:hypothetical protein